jgi:hypothetical protein
VISNFENVVVSAWWSSDIPMLAESSKDVVDTWPKCTRPVADGGGGSERIVKAGGWAAAVDEHAFRGATTGLEAFGVGALGGAAAGGSPAGEPIFCPSCCDDAVGEGVGPAPGVRL